jgi:predicted RND superfamily exporter protein
MSKQKQKGTSAETAVVKHLKGHGYPNVERRALTGAYDKGDISNFYDIVIEVKNHANPRLDEWMEELKTEIKNAEASTGVVIHKRRGTTNVGEWYATMPVSIYLDLVKDAYE